MTRADRLEALAALRGCIVTCRAALVANGKALRRPETDLECLGDADYALDLCKRLTQSIQGERRGRPKRNLAVGRRRPEMEVDEGHGC